VNRTPSTQSSKRWIVRGAAAGLSATILLFAFQEIPAEGHIWGWGDNQGGELRLGNHNKHLTPVRLPFSQVTAVPTSARAADVGRHFVVFRSRGATWMRPLQTVQVPPSAVAPARPGRL
jgi:Regulator of chromosome condensation (RCC1) repeat